MAIARTVSTAVATGSSQPGASWLKYCERLPIVVTPARSVWTVLAVAAGKPIMKSPMCGWMGATWPISCHSAAVVMRGPVSAGIAAR